MATTPPENRGFCAGRSTSGSSRSFTVRARGRPEALLKGATASPSWDQASATSMPRGTAAEAARPWTMREV
nr:hypothetical protein GCM10025732_58240 [Glycomyces mayteni]